MKGISTKIITDEQTVRMHTNFAEFKNVSVDKFSSDTATFSKENGVLKVHTNTIKFYCMAYCSIPNVLLKSGQKYGISLRSSNREVRGFRIQRSDSSHASKENVASHWDGDKIYSVVMLEKADVVPGLGIFCYLNKDYTDYEFRDFRIWEIDDLGGGNS